VPQRPAFRAGENKVIRSQHVKVLAQIRRNEIGEGDNPAAGLGLGRTERVAAAARMADLPGYPHGAGADVDVSHAERGEFGPPEAREGGQQHERPITRRDGIGQGQAAGRPSKSLTLGQAVALMAAAKGTRLEAYVVLSLLTGLRTEEVRALRWDHVVAWVGGQWRPVSEAGFDHEQLAVFVWRADRAGGDTKTPRSRRTLALPRKCVEALREHRMRQAADRLAAGALWKDQGLVFASAVGTPLDDHNVRRQFRVITEAAGLGRAWVPRELRHTFVSLLSAHGVPVEAIALLAGHK
jgi:integrase